MVRCITMFDNPMAWLEENHLELYQSDHVSEGQEGMTSRQKATKTIKALCQNREAILKITLDVIDNAKTVSSVSFKINPHLLTEWKKVFSHKTSFASSRNEKKKSFYRVKKSKSKGMRYLLGLAFNRAILSNNSR